MHYRQVSLFEEIGDCKHKSELLKCQFCGTNGMIDDFELDFINNSGFWCPDCDGYTFFNEEENIKRKFTLILEDKSKRNTVHYKPPIKFNKRLSPLRYPGGKSKLIGYLYSKLQENKCDTFIEAYSGGGSLGLALLESNVINKLILNDIDYGIYSLFYLSVNDPSELVKMLQENKPSYLDFYSAQNIVLGQYKNCNMLEAAWSCLVVNRLAFSGICKAGPLGGKNSQNIDKLLSRWNQVDLINRIEKIYDMKSRIKVFNIDAEELIQEMYYLKNATIFVDPPYFEKGKNLYNYYYTNENHISLATLLDSLYMCIPGADIILTYDNQKYIKELYYWPMIERISRVYSI
ncbi:DNA adenine methylase (plasmid) [Clostridium beijerinckii]|uniref:DNA adenine methylase n=1 Tax=Clostridium beijerinckii TaxID=1520 RepID=UPI002227911A|nr:DNA adenine methylase [Clostridium beijerinckii]UYZ39032.1 DNA adenine methylase [Clostridium beijerinckii]